MVAKGEKCSIKLEDKITGRCDRLFTPPTFYELFFNVVIIAGVYCAGELFAVCPVRLFPGTDVEPVSDSSRYFVLKLEDTSGNL